MQRRILPHKLHTMPHMLLYVLCHILLNRNNMQQRADDVKLSQKEVTQMGAPAAPTISLKEQRGSGQVVTSWTLTLPAVPKGYRLYLNVYQNNNPFDSEVGSWSKDDKGRYEFTPGVLLVLPSVSLLFVTALHHLPLPHCLE